MVNTVQRSPFFKDIILTMGSFNFAIWKEGVMVTNTRRFNCNHKNHSPPSHITIKIEEDKRVTLFNFRKTTSSSRRALSRSALRRAGPCPSQLFSSLGKRMAALRCGTCWKKPADLHRSRHTSPMPRSPASNPGPPPVSPGLHNTSNVICAATKI